MSISIKSARWVLLFSVSIFFINIAQAEEVKKLFETDDLVIEGQNEFRQSCAVCHGEDAKGNGPYSIALVFKPSDLTRLQVDNGGEFPFIETYLVIDGRDIAEYHGSRLMPIWGDRFQSESWSTVTPEFASTLVSGRIFELLLYLYTIQDTSL